MKCKAYASIVLCYDIGLLFLMQRGLRVCVSVCLLVTRMGCAKTAELIAMPFGG